MEIACFANCASCFSEQLEVKTPNSTFEKIRVETCCIIRTVLLSNPHFPKLIYSPCSLIIWRLRSTDNKCWCNTVTAESGDDKSRNDSTFNKQWSLPSRSFIINRLSVLPFIIS